MSLSSFCRRYSLYLISGFLFFFSAVAVLFFAPPFESSAYYPQIFFVSDGETIRSVGEQLKEKHLISSPSLFILSTYAVGGKILRGTYSFLEPRSVFVRAQHLYSGKRNTPLRKIIIPEGSNVYEIADLFAKNFPSFDREGFEKIALEYHGYLYPDTYFLATDDLDPGRLVRIMTETFQRRTGDLFIPYDGPLSKDEIIILASIVELEAHRQHDRRRIAGVLFNRLAINLPLQVDVSFLFISGKNTFDLNRADLATTDPSNTYRYPGIPPLAITNPSRESLEAVLTPISSEDLFFLADFFGNTHFSPTYEEHLRKKALYIDSVKDEFLSE